MAFLQMRQRGASADEAAAIAAAVERFLAETASAPVDPGESASPWGKAALLEGVSARGTTIEDLEGGMR